MTSLNPFNWFESENQNTYKACFDDASGLNIAANSIHSSNFFGYHPVKFKGIEVGYYNIEEVNSNCQVKLDIVLPAKYNIPADSNLEIIESKPGYFNRYSSSYINIVPGNTEDNMKNGDNFLFNQCSGQSSLD